MAQWGVRHQSIFIAQNGEGGSEPPDISNEEESNGEENLLKLEPIFFPEGRKRKSRSHGKLREVKEEPCGRQSTSKRKTKKHESKERWSAER